MKLLLITEKVDRRDPVLGFFHRWVEAFAAACESVTVVCLEAGEYHLPENVRIFSLGKEKRNFQFLKRARYSLRFLKLVWWERHNYNAVFVHMNPVYALLGGIFWRLWRKPIGLWYAHGYVPVSLRLAEKLTDIIFTSTKGGCRLRSRKIRVVGQGIDTEKFKVQSSKFKSENGIFRMVTVGRISPSKDYETLIRACAILKGRGVSFKLTAIGGIGMPEQQSYLDALRREVVKQGLSSEISFVGPMQNDAIAARLEEADLFASASRTGSLDKTLVEAMAMELPVIASNDAFAEILSRHKDMLLYAEGDFRELAAKIEELIELSPQEREKIGKELREIILRGHTVSSLVAKIVSAYSL